MYRLAHLAVVVALFFLGILTMNITLHPYRGVDHITRFLSAEKITVEGLICESPQVSSDRTELVVAASRIFSDGQYIPVSGRILLTFRGLYPFRYGQWIRFKSRLRLPHNFGNPGGFDYERYLLFRGISARGFINDVTGFVILRHDRGSPLRSFLEELRERIRATIYATAPGVEGKIIQAMILGDQKEIPKEVMERFNRTGTTHIIAISGFNIGIVAIFCLFVIRLACKSSEYLLLHGDITKISTIITIIIIILYTYIAGAGISVVRASLMVVVFMIAIVSNRERDLYNTLAFAALIILLISPASLFDVSFQLSFIAVLSLIFLTPRLVSLLPPAPAKRSSDISWKEKIPFYLTKFTRIVVIFFFVTLSATLGTLPLVIYHFNRLPMITFVANLFVVPVLGVAAIPYCQITVLTVPISDLLSSVIVEIAACLVGISLLLVDTFADFSWSSLYVSTPTLQEIAAFYLFLITGGFWLDRWNWGHPEPKKPSIVWKLLPLIIAFFFIFNGYMLYQRDHQQKRLSLTAIDVGQGSATLITLPGGKRILVDGGGSYDERFDVGRYVVAPFLWHKRITCIDTVVLSHPHPDHLQGLLFIMEHFRVREAWTNGQKVDSPLYQSFLQVIHDQGIHMRILSDKTPVTSQSGVTISIMNPRETADNPPGETFSSFPHTDEDSLTQAPHPRHRLFGMTRSRESDSINDRSLVLKISYGQRSFLIPGDILDSTERHLIESDFDIRSDVLIVPHHGAARSSTMDFLKGVKPQIAVISCGKDNVFGFPHPDVLRRLVHSGARIYRTDRDGAVTLSTDGKDLMIDSFHGDNF